MRCFWYASSQIKPCSLPPSLCFFEIPSKVLHLRSTKFSTSSSHEPSSNKTSGLQKEHNLMRKIVKFKRLSCRGPFFELAKIINPGKTSIQMVNSNFYLICCEVFVVILWGGLVGEGDCLMGQRLNLNRTTCAGVRQSCRLGNMM